jgi:hypothetical protein
MRKLLTVSILAIIFLNSSTYTRNLEAPEGVFVGERAFVDDFPAINYAIADYGVVYSYNREISDFNYNNDFGNDVQPEQYLNGPILGSLWIGAVTGDSTRHAGVGWR